MFLLCTGNEDLRRQDGTPAGMQHMAATMHWGPNRDNNRYYLTGESKSVLFKLMPLNDNELCVLKSLSGFFSSHFYVYLQCERDVRLREKLPRVLHGMVTRINNVHGDISYISNSTIAAI